MFNGIILSIQHLTCPKTNVYASGKTRFITDPGLFKMYHTLP